MAKIPTTSTTLLRDVASDSQHARWTEFAARYRPMMEAYLRERFPSVEADDVIQETLVAVWAALPSYRYAPDEKGHFHNYLTGILRNKALRQLYKEQRHAEIAEMVHDDASCDGRARSQVSPERSEPRKRIRRALRGGRDYSGPSQAQASAESLEVCTPPGTSSIGRAGTSLPGHPLRGQPSAGGYPRMPPDVMADDEQSWRETLVEIALRQLMNDESIQSRTRQVFLRVVVNGEKPEAVAAAFGITCNGVYLIKNRMMPRLQKIVAALEKAGNI